MHCLFWHPRKGVVSRCGQMENENLDLVQFYDDKLKLFLPKDLQHQKQD